MAASTKLRKDAALNRARIVEVAETYLESGRQLQLNDIAREAGVGVATVYRHFPTPEALLEHLARPRMEELEAAGLVALESGDLWRGLEGFLRLGLQAQLADPALAAVLAAPEHADARTVELVASLNSIAMRLVARVKAEGYLVEGLEGADLFPLMCGVAYAARLGLAADPHDAGLADRFLDALLLGVRVR
ncbi:TetR/AcrR family transcriptional regulator [Demequina gelatinilytica]|uniref:TetR/AcrR family transcriptional regulator n=1 Tax=Demequina gelatinilytica TaxID=1638980 RepID=UPI0007844598|nr:TetR/AcrR family transcriptional regulator [Demequina gelatinilytica]